MHHRLKSENQRCKHIGSSLRICMPDLAFGGGSPNAIWKIKPWCFHRELYDLITLGICIDSSGASINIDPVVTTDAAIIFWKIFVSILLLGE